MDISRSIRHLLVLPGSVERAFSAAGFVAIGDAITQAEKQTGAEIRFAVEGALEPAALWRDMQPRERALQVFAEQRVWDTERNNGVLVYLLLADRDIEIVADRGFNGKVSADQWEQACRAMEAGLASGARTEAVVAGIRAVASLCERAFPPVAGDANELPDKPAVL
jgi:uncharacterized membrane protein